MNHSGKVEADIKIGDGVVTIHRRGVSQVTTAGLLGVEHDKAGEPVRLYLDRMIHRPRETEIGGWRVSGAISSILTKEPRPKRT